MRLRLLAPFAAALLFGGLWLATPPAAAQDNVEKELRLLTLEGQFTQAAQMLANAPEEVRNDAKLREQLGKMALQFVRRKDGIEKVPGLLAASEHYAAAAALGEGDEDATLEALQARLELVDLQIAEKQTDRAKAHADWCVSVGEDLLENGADTPEIRMALAKGHDHVAKLSHKVDGFEAIVTSYGRSADLLVSCAETAKNPAEALGKAAQVYLDMSTFITNVRPIEEETRDEEALVKAIETARLAAEHKQSSRDEHLVHLLALREAHRQKLPGSHGKPFMEELGKREGIDGLNLQLPKAGGWTALDQRGEWDMVLERKLPDDTSAVQVMIRVWEFSQSFGGRGWDQVEKVAGLRYEEQSTNDFDEVLKSTEPEQLDTGRKGPEIWHFELTGSASGRTKRVAEWMMMRAKKEKVTYQIRLIDWRKAPDLLEPDIVEFLRLALDQPDPDEDDKGKKKKKRRR